MQEPCCSATASTLMAQTGPATTMAVDFDDSKIEDQLVIITAVPNSLLMIMLNCEMTLSALVASCSKF